MCDEDAGVRAVGEGSVGSGLQVCMSQLTSLRQGNRPASLWVDGVVSIVKATKGNPRVEGMNRVKWCVGQSFLYFHHPTLPYINLLILSSNGIFFLLLQLRRL